MEPKKIKICGLRDPKNILDIIHLDPDYLGFIFFRQSSRYVQSIDESFLHALQIKKTAVFVNSSITEVDAVLNTYSFEAVQLHGSESAEYCKELNRENLEVIKAFGVNEDFEWEQLRPYLDCVDFFLFDTLTPMYGGSGKSFNWKILEEYPFSKPYFLSGGIGPENFKEACAISDDRLYALDLNSKFESFPGYKDIQLLKKVIK